MNFIYNVHIAIFTKEELIEVIKPIVKQRFLDTVEIYFNGGDMIDGFGSVNLEKFRNWENTVSENDLIRCWCDFLSESFFDDNPHIQVVLYCPKNGCLEYMANNLDFNPENIL